MAEKVADADGHSYDTMMSQAGRAVVAAIEDQGDVQDKKILILVGTGNNGGDGLVAGRYLANLGADVAFYFYKSRQDENFLKVQKQGLNTIFAEYDQRFRVLRTRLKITDVMIDALLGTGVSRPIEGSLAKLMSQVADGIAERNQILAGTDDSSLTFLQRNQLTTARRVFVVAVDVPSGVHSDSGEADRLTLSADLTITFHAPKYAHFLFPAAEKCGELVVADIGIAPKYTQDIQTEVATPQQISDWLPKRPLDGHKGTFGSTLIAGGSRNYLGAPILSGMGAYRVGAGLVALAVPKALRQLGATHLPEATFPMLPAADYLDSDSAKVLSVEKYQSLLLGPGLGDESDQFLQAVLSLGNLPPLICDADALNYLSRQAEWWKLLPPTTILTPHPGEMSRLVGHDIRAENRFELAQTYAQKWGHIVVLKGAFTIVAAADGRLMTIPIATPLLATAGSGDVLAGAIAGLLAQGLESYHAAVVGAYLHAAAGQSLTKAHGNSGLLAHEIAGQLPSVRKRLSPEHRCFSYTDTL